MSSRTLYRLSGMVLLIGSLLIAVSIIISAFNFHVADRVSDPNILTSQLWFIVHIMALVGELLVLISITGMYIRQAEHSGRLGMTGFVLTFVGVLIVGAGGEVIFTFVFPFIATSAPQLLAGDLPPAMVLFLMVGNLCFIVGPILLGIATMRARVLPGFIGMLFIAGGILTAFTIVPLPSPFSEIISATGGVLLFLGFAASGFVLFSGLKAEEVASPVVATKA